MCATSVWQGQARHTDDTYASPKTTLFDKLLCQKEGLLPNLKLFKSGALGSRDWKSGAP